MTNADLFVFFRNATIFLATIMLAKYFIFLVLAAFFPVREQLRRRRVLKRELKQKGYISEFKPLLSVIIPAWNEEIGIIRTIQSVLDNDYRNVEILVVNDGSTDKSRMIVDTFIDEYKILRHQKRAPHWLRQFYIPNGGKGAALNYGIRRSRGEIVLTIDADSALAPDALSKLVEYFRDPNVAAVVGQVRVANGGGRVIGMMQQLEYLFGFYFKRAHCVMGAEYIYGGACAAFRRSKTFDYFGAFDEKNKTEDIEMSMRTKFHGLKSLYAEDVICYTEGAPTYWGLINQRLRWKKGRFDTFLAYRRMFFSLDRRHNKPLSWFILPYAMFSEIQLLLEPIAATLLITYSLISSEYVSLAMSMLFIGITYIILAMFGTKMSWKERVRLLLLWPITWPLFYVVVWIEFHALLRSMHMVIRGDALEWQKWQREGI
jgi:cellulose synthase/poly-beta-1,6-N-acetylglucosamine synthase-like glycosyltransferase